MAPPPNADSSDPEPAAPSRLRGRLTHLRHVGYMDIARELLDGSTGR